MIFTSFTFIIFFCILIICLLASKNNTFRINVLLVASYIFYGWWNINYLLLIFIVSFTGWGFAYLISKEKKQAKRKLYLYSNLLICLGMLGYFKYTNFFLDTLNQAFDFNTRPLDILLPVGISFFTFQTLSYTLDIYRNKIPVCKSFIKFALFVSFFPQLVAGPIVRASEFLPQLEKKIILTKENFIIGSQIFLGGALQKVFVADNLSQYVDIIYKTPEIYSQISLWIAVLAYSIQIFCDFSGYSLMAIGIARILGFELPKNFNMPYNAKSITEFWHRWHMSLSLWLRDYLYISLGGNRKGTFRTQLNMLITMLLGGLWHGASWNFVIWGALHGIALGVNRFWSLYLRDTIEKRVGGKLYNLQSWLITIIFVSLLWVPFRSPDTETTFHFIQRLFFASDGVIWYPTQTLIILLLVSVWHIVHHFNIAKLLSNFPVKSNQLNSYRVIFVIMTSVYLIALFAPMNTSPFIYFQF